MKEKLRRHLLKARDQISPETKRSKEAAIRKRLYSSAAFRNARNILFFASFRSEVDTIKCIRHSISIKKTISLPRVDPEKKRLLLFRIKDLSELEPGCMGIPEPNVDRRRIQKLRDIDLIIVPGAGFDEQGNRIGYGGGYYDRLLSDTGKDTRTISLAFEEQMVEKIPAEAHDKKVEFIITDRRTIKCRKYS